MQKIKNYLSDDSALSGSVEQILFICGAIGIAGIVIAVIWNKIKNQTESSSCDNNDSPWCVE